MLPLQYTQIDYQHLHTALINTKVFITQILGLQCWKQFSPVMKNVMGISSSGAHIPLFAYNFVLFQEHCNCCNEKMYLFSCYNLFINFPNTSPGTIKKS